MTTPIFPHQAGDKYEPKLRVRFTDARHPAVGVELIFKLPIDGPADPKLFEAFTEVQRRLLVRLGILAEPSV